MPIPLAHIQVEGYREFQRELKSAMGSMPKELGEAHKEVGRFVIDMLEPPPRPETVGTGAGSSVRPSAKKREVVLYAGGKHRDRRFKQWGKKQVNPWNTPEGERPYIVGTALKYEREIREELGNALLRALSPAFNKTDRL